MYIDIYEYAPYLLSSWAGMCDVCVCLSVSVVWGERHEEYVERERVTHTHA